MMSKVLLRIALLLGLLPLAAAGAELGRIHALVPAVEEALVATSQGLFRVGADGRHKQVSSKLFSALTPLSGQPGVLLGSSDRLLRSDDEGLTWRPVSSRGPKRFAILATTPAAPKLVYGVAGGLYRSNDEGRLWQRVGDLPRNLASVAVSAKDPRTLYAASGEGLKVSRDGGESWQAASMLRVPATLAATTADGHAYSFVWGQGLLRAKDPSLAWKPLFNGFGGQGVVRFAATEGALFASTTAGKLFVSRDDGASWTPFGGVRESATAAAKRGEQLYATNCVSCHGERGIGETPRLGGPQQTLAPALDDTAHAWHHLDGQLVTTILEGGPTRMPAWRGTLTRDNAEDLVAYIKSLWDERALNCQGPAHMRPDCQR